MLILSFPAADFEFLAWAAFVPLFFALEGKSFRQAFLLAYTSGFVFWLGTVYWLVHVTSLGVLLLVLYLALYWAVFGLAVYWIISTRSKTGVLFVPSAWVIIEYGRSYILTGFPWALLGYSQSKFLPIIQFADITGVWGVSFLVMLVNFALYGAAGQIIRKKALNKTLVVAACCFFIAAYIYGEFKLKQPDGAIAERTQAVKISVIQGNIPQNLKWDSRAGEYIFSQYRRLSRKAAEDLPDLIVWPEAAVPVILTESADSLGALQAAAGLSKFNLLAGAVTRRNDAYYNSAVLFKPDSPIEIYDKLHLVPFGEYIPLRSIFGFLETIVPIGEARPGIVYKVFDFQPEGLAKPVRFSSLICFEDVFPGLSRKFVGKGARFLVVSTNDAWYRETSAPYQHMQASIFRSIENRVPVIRSANTGVSGFIDAQGRVEQIVRDSSGKAIFVEGYVTRAVRTGGYSVTIYTRFGDWMVLAALLMVVLSFSRGCAVPCVRRHL